MYIGTLEIYKVIIIILKMHDYTIYKEQLVHHGKGLKKNLMSIENLDDLEFNINSENGILKEVKENLVVMKAEKMTSNLYMFLGHKLREENESITVTSQEETTMMWHHRLGHMSKRGLNVLATGNLLHRLKMIDFRFYEHDVISRQRKFKFSGVTTKRKYILDLVHSDVWESPTKSLSKAKKKLFHLFRTISDQVELEMEKKIQ